VQQLKRFRIGAISRKFAARAAISLLVTAVLFGCGGGEKKAQQEREQLVRDKLDRENKGGILTETVLDSLRAMKERFGITRDEYWDKTGGVLANDFIELWYPAGPVTVTHGMYAFGQLVAAQGRFNRYFGRDPGDHLTVICAETMPEFTDDTGFQWYVYAKVSADEIVFQPVDVLYVRTLAEVAVQRTYHEWGIGRLSAGRSPQWLMQGLSSLLAGEEQVLENQMKEFEGSPVKLPLDKIEIALRKKEDRKAYRIALYDAWRMVRRLAAAHGQEKVAEVIVLMGSEKKRDKAFRKVFGQSYDQVVSYALEFKVNQ
jgi:hypothetical protein